MGKGRPLKLSADTQGQLEKAIKLGSTYKLAAAYAGISYATLNNWMNKGKAELERREKGNGRLKVGTAKWDDAQPFVDLLEAIKEAEGIAAVQWLAKIEKAASNGAWQAAAWKLERRYPNEYGRTVVDKNVSADVKVKLSWGDDSDR